MNIQKKIAFYILIVVICEIRLKIFKNILFSPLNILGTYAIINSVAWSYK